MISENAYTALRLLSDAGYPSYLVGGCVRDSIMGIDAHNTDITSPAEPEQVKSVFRDYRVIETGIRHGTATVLIGGEAIEITTFRTESVYSDNRHPDAVSFSKNLSDDLSRRDFTVNALCFDEDGKIIDLFGGMQDLENRTIRCIGKAEERFREDSLRILRALRFSSKLGFEIDRETEKAMFDCRGLLNNLSAERVYSELKKILCGSYAGKTTAKYYDILVEVLPEIKGMKDFDQHNFHHIYDVLEHTVRVVDAVRPEPYMRFAALFHDCAKPDCFSLDSGGVSHFYSHAPKGADKARQALLRLKADNSTLEKTVKLVRIHDSPIEADERTIKRKLQKLGEPMLYDLIELQRADNLAQSPQFLSRQKHFDELIRITKSVIEQSECFSLRQLAVNGDDLKRSGYEGRTIGKALNLLLNAVIDEKAENEKTSLLSYLESRYPPKQN